jgi:hypothetical protein
MKVYRSTADVAAWCDVVPSAVSMWLRRYDDWPEPDVEVRTEKTGYVVRGWLPSRRAEWVRYAKRRTKPGPYKGGSVFPDWARKGQRVTGTWLDAEGHTFRIINRWPYPGKTPDRQFVTLRDEASGLRQPATIDTLKPII